MLRDTGLTNNCFPEYNAPGISEMKRSTFHRSTSGIFFKNADKQKRVQRCKYSRASIIRTLRLSGLVSLFPFFFLPWILISCDLEKLKRLKFQLSSQTCVWNAVLIYFCLKSSLRIRRLEVVGERENGRARGGHACLLLARRFFLCPLLPSACHGGYLKSTSGRRWTVNLSRVVSRDFWFPLL